MVVIFWVIPLFMWSLSAINVYYDWDRGASAVKAFGDNQGWVIAAVIATIICWVLYEISETVKAESND